MGETPNKPTEKTRLTHLGRDTKASKGFVNPPLYRGSTVLFPTIASMSQGGYGYWYGRKESPTFKALEQAINDLEQSADTVLTPSGLSAITTSLLALLKTGDHLLVSDSVYQPTRTFCDGPLKDLGVETTYYDPTIGSQIETLLQARTKVIFLESPGSQTMEIQDVPAIQAVAASRGIKTIIDNTYATPLNFKPLTHGVDVSIHSGTKYFIGHADGLIGTISSNAATAKTIRQTAYALGICASPEDAQLALRGLRTLKIRLDHHEQNALEIAKWLQQQAEVAVVLHPALPSHPSHEIFARDFSGSTGLFSFVLKPTSKEALARMVDGMQHFAIGWSWGGYESLILPFDPAPYRTATTWPHQGPALRLHIGHEDVSDLKADLKAGLERL